MSARAELGLAYLLGAMAFAAVALWAGQDANWDLQNYHIYAAYALLHWRYPLDVGPGAFQGYFNPLPYVPQYLLRTAFPPRAAAVSLAAMQAMVVPVAWAITGQLPGLMSRPALRALATATGCSAAMILSEIGTSFADLLLAPLVLGGLWAALHPGEGRRPWLRAGLPIGLAAGLKATNALYAPGLLAAAVLPWRGWRPAAGSAAWAGAGLTAGAALTGGAWAGYLWVRFSNPVFPAMNTWFRSSSAAISDFTERCFLPSGALDALVYPLRIAWGYEVGGWLDAGARGVAAVGPVARLVLRPARIDGPRVLILEMDGQAPLRVDGMPAGQRLLCLPPGPDIRLVFGDPEGPALKVTLRTMRLRRALPGECCPAAQPVWQTAHQ